MKRQNAHGPDNACTVIYRSHPTRPASFLCITGIAASVLTPAFAVAAPPVIQSVDFDGRGCDAARATTRLDTSTCDFEIRFLDLFAASSLGADGSDQNNCEVEVSVLPPPGFRLAIAGATLEGAARTGGGGTASVEHSYAIEKSDGSFSSLQGSWSTDDTFRGTDVRPFSQTFGAAVGASDPSQIPSEWMGGCGKPTKVKGSLELFASAATPGAGDEAEVYADRTRSTGTARSTGKLAWDWMLVPCEDPLDALQGAWSFRYLAVGGREAKGRMTFAGAGGRYRPAGSPWEGVISDLRSEGGDVNATWKASGSSGWVRFTPSDDGASFTGEWGYSGAAATGYWDGTKE